MLSFLYCNHDWKQKLRFSHFWIFKKPNQEKIQKCKGKRKSLFKTCLILFDTQVTKLFCLRIHLSENYKSEMTNVENNFWAWAPKQDVPFPVVYKKKELIKLIIFAATWQALSYYREKKQMCFSQSFYERHAPTSHFQRLQTLPLHLLHFTL